jgi:hypothetical protein
MTRIAHCCCGSLRAETLGEPAAVQVPTLAMAYYLKNPLTAAAGGLSLWSLNKPERTRREFARGQQEGSRTWET